MATIAAHMAGIVTEIKVQVGDQIIQGQEVAVLEAMKMQMPIVASAAGKVKKIPVSPGDFVNEGDNILEMA